MDGFFFNVLFLRLSSEGRVMDNSREGNDHQLIILQILLWVCYEDMQSNMPITSWFWMEDTEEFKGENII